MAIPSGNIKYWYDTSDPASYPGSGTTLYDLSGNGNDITFSACTFQDPRKVLFLTRNDFGQFNSSLIPAGNNVYTFEIWQKRDSTTAGSPGFDAVFGVGLTGSNDRIINNTDTPTGTTALTVRTATGPAYTAGSFSTAWNHWVFLYDGTNGKIYLNGVQVNSTVTGTQANGILRDTDNTAVACFNGLFYSGGPVGSGPTQRFPGFIGEFGYFRIYDIALTAGQVLDQYEANFARFYPGKVYLNASEPASAVAPYTTWNDLTNSYDFTMYSPSFTTSTSSTPAYYSFPSRDYTTPVSIYGEYNGTPAVTATNNFTGYFWVRRNADHGSYTQNRLSIFANGREDLVGGDNGWSYGAYNNPNAANNNVTIERANYGVIDSGYTFADATWINIAITVDGSNVVTFYQDGVIKGGPGFSWGATSPADGMWISRTAGSYFSWMGDISIIRQYDTALTQAQIQALYEYDLANYINPTPPPSPPYGLVGGRTFGQGFAG